LNPAQVKRLRELPSLIANEPDAEKLEILAAEMQELATIELDEMRSKFVRSCPTCGVELGVHTAEMLEQCANKQRDL